jgi:hypothetical protein
VLIAVMAGASATIGLGVAAGLWSKFSRTASQSDYEPWNFGDLDNLVSNPLYETQSKEFDNPVYTISKK